MPNELYIQWVKEWLEEAKERNSKGVTVYKKAHKSIKECPITITHPSELMVLQGFGEKLCKRLHDKLQKHCDENGLPMPKRPSASKRKKPAAENDDGNQDTGESGPSPVKKPRKVKPYVPKPRSGGFGLILGLATLAEDSRAGITKDELIDLAQPLCTASYRVPDQTNKFFTAWNAMKSLVERDMVYKKGRPERYYLSEDGWALAKRLKTQADGGDAGGDDIDKAPIQRSPSSTETPDIVPLGNTISSMLDLPSFTPIVLQPGSFTVQMVLDNREVRTQKDRDYVQDELTKKLEGAKPITRALQLGDVTWVAKVNHQPGESNEILLDYNANDQPGESSEILLDYIVERKRVDDLVSSIKDGRFNEQKFRLGKSGIKNVIYLIEDFNMSADYFQKYEAQIQSSIASAQVVNGYFVKKTLNINDSIQYLASLTKLLKEKYERQPLHIIPTNVLTTSNYLPLLAHLEKRDPGSNFYVSYAAFASMSSKSDALTLRDIYLKMLMCTRGITGEKALEIQKRWKTPIELIEAYEAVDRTAENVESGKKKKKVLMSNEMGDLVGRKKIAKALSEKVAEVWGDTCCEVTE